MRAFHADAVITGDAGVYADGAVVIDDTGEVKEVGPAAAVLPNHAGARVERVHGVVLPGLVNAHTHLELSALSGYVPGGAGFVRWVENLIGSRIEVHPEADDETIERAVADLHAFGTVAVGEVTNSLAAVPALARGGFAGCVFHEVFGVDLATAERRIADLPHILAERVGEWTAPDLAYAASPHTLYTTHPEAVRRLLETARDQGARVSIHLAEHASERRYLEHGDGPVSEWYESRLKIPKGSQAPAGKGPVALADELGALAPFVLGVHFTDARPAELELVARRGTAVVLCPRSNLHIEAKLPPLLAVLGAGIKPALGTDSLASNASLDVLAEARALADRFPTVPAVDLLRMATWSGAVALGLSSVGRIAPGARPGLFAIEGNVPGDAAAFVLSHVKAPRRWLALRHGAVS